MSDLDDLGGGCSSGLRFNALTDALSISRYNASTKQRHIEENPLGSRWAADMLTRQRGLAKVTENTFDFRLTPAGSPAPGCKPEIALLLYSPDRGLAEIRTSSAMTVG
jgi:hypothetical protein